MPHLATAHRGLPNNPPPARTRPPATAQAHFRTTSAPAPARSSYPNPPTAAANSEASAQPYRPPAVNASGFAPQQPQAPVQHPVAPNLAPGHTTALARTPEESYHDQVLRIKGIDTNDRSRFADGTASIPTDIEAAVARIKSLRMNGNGYPFRNGLKTIQEHFLQEGGKLRMESTLWAWYGDTRLFSRQVWMYLASEGRGENIQ